MTTKPLILDAAAGGLPEHFSHPGRAAERLGISTFVIQDKTGLKKNSLLGNEVRQTQAPVRRANHMTRNLRLLSEVQDGIYRGRSTYTSVAPHAFSNSRNTDRWQCASSSQ